MKKGAKKIAALGVLLAAASIVFLIESLIPPLLPIAPYVKIGLANCFELFVLIPFGARVAFLLSVAKSLVTALFSLNGFTILFNLAGSLCAYLIMAGLYIAVFPKISLVSVSVAGAVMSNIARTCVAVSVMEAPSLFVQLPAVCAFGVAAGIIIGVLTTLSVKHLPERLTNFRE